MANFIRTPAENLFEEELKALTLRDSQTQTAIPPGWKLSPVSVRDFLLGLPGPLEGDAGQSVIISQKYIGNSREIELCIATLCSDRALLMVGPPGTGKSCISEWLSAAISGNSRLILQGNSGVTEDQVKYSWNFSLLLQKGPTKEALKPSPMMLAMGLGQICRFEEVTRCAQEVQDTLISILSEKEVSVPEMGNTVFQARYGFNLIGTANTADKGVHELSAALKRRFNFVTIPILSNIKEEQSVIQKRVAELGKVYGIPLPLPQDLLTILTKVCQELREGKNFDTNEKFEGFKSQFSTAEMISLIFNCTIHFNFFGKNMGVDHGVIARELIQTLTQEDSGLKNQFKNYCQAVMAQRTGLWKNLFVELVKVLD